MKRNQGRCFYGGERGAVTLFARFHMRKLPHCHGWIFNILSIKISQIKSGILLFLLQTEENALRAHWWLNTNMRRLNTVARAAPAVVPRISVWLPFVSDCRLGFFFFFLSCFCLGQTGRGRHAGPRVARFRGDCCSERVCVRRTPPLPPPHPGVSNAAVNHHKGGAAVNILLTSWQTNRSLARTAKTVESWRRRWRRHRGPVWGRWHKAQPMRSACFCVWCTIKEALNMITDVTSDDCRRWRASCLWLVSPSLECKEEDFPFSFSLPLLLLVCSAVRSARTVLFWGFF